MIDISGMTDKEKEMGTSTDTKTEGMTSIQFEKILGYLQGIPVFESDFVAEDTAVLINRKTGAGKIIEYEVRIHQLEKENKSLKDKLDKDRVVKIIQKFGLWEVSHFHYEKLANEIIENPEKGL